jgi:hypothetical protein
MADFTTSAIRQVLGCKRFVGLTWQDGDKKGGFAMQCRQE